MNSPPLSYTNQLYKEHFGNVVLDLTDEAWDERLGEDRQ